MLVVIYGYKPVLDRRFMRLSSMVTMVGGHCELWAVALLKAVWCGMHLASLLTCLFFCLYGYGFLSGEKS